MISAEQTYSGETRHRKKWLAVVLTLICPGLGSMYVGHMLRGLMINLLFLMGLELFIIIWSLEKFFPLLPLIVFIVGWLVFSSLLAVDNARQIDETQAYVLKGYNHWTIYLVAFLLSFVVPIALTIGFTTGKLWQLSPVQTDAMYPGLQPGDTVLTDLNALNGGPPERGDVVTVKTPGSGDTSFLRVVATQGDIVRMEGDTLYVNDEAIAHSPLENANAALSDLDEDSGLLALVEHNQGSRYVIAVSPRVFSDLTLPPTRLEPDRYFLLTDNRSQVPIVDARNRAETQDSAADLSDAPVASLSRSGTHPIRDSRHFGTVSADNIKGKPRYIFWSRAPDGSVRWERIGLRIH